MDDPISVDDISLSSGVDDESPNARMNGGESSSHPSGELPRTMADIKSGDNGGSGW